MKRGLKPADERLMLRAIRRQRGLSTTSLASRSGIGRSSLCDMENGRKPVTLKTLRRVAEACGYHITMVFGP